MRPTLPTSSTEMTLAMAAASYDEQVLEQDVMLAKKRSLFGRPAAR